MDVLNLIARVTGQEADPAAADATRVAFQEIDALFAGERDLAMEEARAAQGLDAAQAAHDAEAKKVRALERAVEKAKGVLRVRTSPQGIADAQKALDDLTGTLVRETATLQRSDTALQRAIALQQARSRAFSSSAPRFRPGCHSSSRALGSGASEPC